MLRLILALLVCVPAFAWLGAKLMENKGHAPLPDLSSAWWWERSLG